MRTFRASLFLGALALLAFPPSSEAQVFFTRSTRPYGYGFGAMGGSYSSGSSGYGSGWGGTGYGSGWGGTGYGSGWGGAGYGGYGYPGIGLGGAGYTYNTPSYYVTPPVVTQVAPLSFNAYAIRPASYAGVPAMDYTPAPRMRSTLEPAVPYGLLPVDVSRANLELRLPSGGALLWLNNVLTQQTGDERSFVTPPLSAGSTYSYDVRIEWYDASGRLQTRQRKIDVRAGENKIVNLTAG